MAKMLPEAKNAKGNWQCRENIWVGPFVFGSFFWLLRRHQCFSHPGGEGGHSTLCGWRSCLVLRRRIGPKGGHPVNFRRPPAFFWPTRPIPSFLFFFFTCRAPEGPFSMGMCVGPAGQNQPISFWQSQRNSPSSLLCPSQTTAAPMA